MSQGQIINPAPVDPRAEIKKLCTPEVEKAELERIEKIRLRIVLFHPFFRVILLPMRTIIDPFLDAPAATNGFDFIKINPLRSKKYTNQEMTYIVCHEVLHTALKHIPRRANRDPKLWNYAIDFAANQILNDMLQDGNNRLRELYSKPKDGCHDEKYRGLAAEEIYGKIYEQLQDGKGKCPGEGDGKLDDHESFPSDDPDAKENINDRILQAAEEWRKCERGTLPGEIEMLIKLLKKSVVPWTRILWRFLGEHLAKDDATYSPPNKKYYPFDLIMPSYRSEHLDDIVIAIDTSGSCVSVLPEFAAELAKLNTLVPTITVITCDAEIQEVVKPCELSAWLAKRKFKGGGGTDHHPVFEYIQKNKIRPNLLIGLTDGYSSFPEKKPVYPVLWVLTPQNEPPPWGEQVVMNPKPKPGE